MLCKFTMCEWSGIQSALFWCSQFPQPISSHRDVSQGVFGAQQATSAGHLASVWFTVIHYWRVADRWLLLISWSKQRPQSTVHFSLLWGLYTAWPCARCPFASKPQVEAILSQLFIQIIPSPQIKFQAISLKLQGWLHPIFDPAFVAGLPSRDGHPCRNSAPQPVRSEKLRFRLSREKSRGRQDGWRNIWEWKKDIWKLIKLKRVDKRR